MPQHNFIPDPNEQQRSTQTDKFGGIDPFLLTFKEKHGTLSPGEIVKQGPTRVFGPGYHPVFPSVTRVFEQASQQQLQGLPTVLGDVNSYVEGRLGYLPSYWEDPHRIGKWYHKLLSIPAAAPLPDWLDRGKVNAAYKYFEKLNGATPWWSWKFLHPTDPARQFLQGFETPPPEMLTPEELLYTPGQSFGTFADPTAGPPLPGTREWKKLDIWQKVQISIFGQGPSILEPYGVDENLGPIGPALRGGLASFGRGFASGAPTGAAIGLFAGGPAGAFTGALVTGSIGGLATIGLETIAAHRQKGLGFEILGVSDNKLEWLLNNMLAGIQAPAEIVERAAGVTSQVLSSLADPDQYGPVSEVFAGLRIEIALDPRGTPFVGGDGPIRKPFADEEEGIFIFTPTTQGQAFLVPYLGGPTGQSASLFFEEQVGVGKVITHGLEYTSYALSNLLRSGGLDIKKESLQLSAVDEVWDLGSTVPHKIGPQGVDTAVGVFLWAQTTLRQELMTSNVSPRELVLAVGQRFGITGILSDLLLQAALDPLNFVARAEVNLIRGVATKKGIGGIVARMFGVGDIERTYLSQAVAMIDAERGRVQDIRGLGSVSKYLRGTFQVGAPELIRVFANILRTGDDAFRIQEISGMSTFARWLGGVTKEGTLSFTLEPTGLFGKLFKLTPKARATKFLFTSHDVIKLMLADADTAPAAAKIFDAMANGDPQAWQKAGMGILGTPDGHYPVLAARDFNVEIVKNLLQTWEDASPQRQVLTQLQEIFGHETVQETTRLMRDYGDAAWQKLQEKVNQAVLAGDEQAVNVKNLIDTNRLTKAILEDTVKGGLSGEIPLSLDHFRWMLYDAWLTHVSEWVVKSFNVKIDNSLYRLSNALKQGASILLLDGNPGYLYANFWNNVSTQLVDGQLGFNSLPRIIDYFESRLGFSPSRLEQAFGGPAGTIGEAGLVTRAELATMSLEDVVAKGIDLLEYSKAREAATFNKLNDVSRGQGAITVLDRALGSLRQKTGQKGLGRFSPLLMSRFSAFVERLQGANAFYKGAKSWLARSWRRGIGFDKMPDGIEAKLGPELAEKIYGHIENNLLYKDIETGLLEDGVLQANVHQFAEGAAKAMGDRYTAADMMAMLEDADILPVLDSELRKAKTSDDLHRVFMGIEENLHRYINEIHVLDVIEKAREAGEAIKAGDLTGLHDTWLDLNARMSEWWTSHVIEWGNIVEEAGILATEGHPEAADSLYKTRLQTAKLEANRIMEMQTAVIDGIVQGLEESGVSVGKKFALGLRTQVAEWRSFFDYRDAVWEEYGQARRDGTIETGRYTEIIEDLGGRYDLRIEDDLDLQGIMDAEIVQATAKVNLRAATVLEGLLSQIREHKALMGIEESAVRQAVHELWNLTTGGEAANVLLRNFSGHEALLKAFEPTIRQWKGRKGEVKGKDLRSFRRIVYDVWSRDVKVEHIRDYYLMRAEGMVEVMSEGVQPVRQDVELPEPIRDTPETDTAIVEADRTIELIESGLDPVESARVAADQAAGQAMEVDYSKSVTLEEIRLRAARDAGIATATKRGAPFDGHLINVLNKDLGLNDTPMKLRTLDDLLNLRRAGGQEGDALIAARQAIVNRGADRLRYKQESRIVNLSVEALETLDGGIENIGTKKLRRIGADNGLTEANLMPKEHIFSWLDARRNRLRPTPFDSVTPEILRQQIKDAMDRGGYPGSEVAEMEILVMEARADAIGMSLSEFLGFRWGIDNPDIAYTFSQMEGRPENPYITQARNLFETTRDIRNVEVGWLLDDGDVLIMERAHPQIGNVFLEGDTSLRSVERFMEFGAVRFRVQDGIVAVEFKGMPNAQQRVKLSSLIDGNKGYVVEFRSLSGGTILNALDQNFPKRSQVQSMWRSMIQAAEENTTMLFQNPDAHRPMYSHLSRVIDAKMPERMPADQFFNFLKKQGVRLDELKWSGVEEFVAGLREGDRLAQDMPIPIIEKSTAQAVIRDLTPLVKETIYPVPEQPLQISRVTWRTDLLPADVRGLTHFSLALGPQVSWVRGINKTLVESGSIGFKDRQGSSANYVIHEFETAPQAPYPALGEGRFFLTRYLTDDIKTVRTPGETGTTRMLFESVDAAKGYVEGQLFESTARRARYESVTYPGGTNYRELVLHLPSRKVTMEGLLAKVNDVFAEEVTLVAKPLTGAIETLGLDLIRRNYTGAEFPGVQQAVATHDAYLRTLGIFPDAAGTLPDVDYQSPHFSEPNTIAFPRLKDRFTADGRKILFVEELQSDWGQTWRDMRGQLRGFEGDADVSGRFPPPMPWEKTWHEFAMRRLMQMAAAEGYEGIGWNTGDGMFRTETGNFPADLDARGTGFDWEEIALTRRPETTDVGELMFNRYDLSITRKDGTVDVQNGMSRSEVETMIGHDLLVQVEEGANTNPNDDGSQSFGMSADDVEVTRSDRMLKGFNAFYDEILPSYMRKETKKWGAQVENMQFESSVASTKADILQLKRADGEPLFIQAQGDYAGPKFEIWYVWAEDIDHFRTGETVMMNDLDEVTRVFPHLTAEEITSIGRLRNGGLSDGHVVYITDEMRTGTSDMRLFQMGSEADIRANELQARQALSKALNAEGLSAATLSRLINGEDIRSVFGGIEVPEQYAHVQRITKAQRQEFRARYGLPNSVDVGQGQFGRLPAELFVDDANAGRPVALLMPDVMRADVPAGVFDAYEAWQATAEKAKWLDGQTRMFQGPLGSTEIGRDGRALMRFFDNANPLTVTHEIGHIFRLDLQPTELDVVVDWLKHTVRNWEGKDLTKIEMHEGKFLGEEGVPRAAEEAFARAYERYRVEGVAPTEKLKAVFDRFTEWLLKIYQKIKGSGIDIPLNEGMRALFSDMLGGRAPEFDIYNTTWQTIGTDAAIRGQPEIAAPIKADRVAVVSPPDLAPGTGLVGNQTTAHGADPNVMYDFVYRIMGISEVTASHTLEGNLTKGYPKSLQPRDRSRAASVRQSQQIAAELNPNALLEPTSRIDEGSPIIGFDGLVESGNARVNALRIAMLDFPEGYAAYKQLLIDMMKADTYGDMYAYDPKQGDFPENPILVRERLTDINRNDFARLANESAILGTSAAEQAAIDVGKISDNMLTNLIISEGQTIQDALLSRANQNVVREFVNQSPRSDQAVLIQRDGSLTRQGMDRILAALFQYVYGSEDGGLRLAENVFESTDPVIKNITNGMMAAAGDMAQAEALIKSGRRPDTLSVTADLTAAVETMLSLKQQKVRIEDFTGQSTLEGFGVDATPFQIEILMDLEVGKRSAKAIRELLQSYARLVVAEPETGQMGLLGPHEYPTAQEMWARARDKPASTAELFQLPEQYKNRGHYDATPGIREGAAKSSEGFRNMLSVLDELRDQMTSPEGAGYLQEIKSQDVRSLLSQSEQSEFKKWTKGLKSQLTGTKFSGVKWGEDVRNYSLLDYTALRGIDTTFLGIPFNYAFWPTRTIMRWMIRFGEFPALMANYARLNEARRKQEERPGFPRRLQGKMYMPIPWMQDWMGDGLWIDPIRQFFPPHMFLDNVDRIATAENRNNKRTEYILRKWIQSGEAHPRDVQEALFTRDGPLWLMASDQAKTEQLQEFEDPLDYLSLVTGLNLPLSIAHEFIRGTPEKIGPLPLTRYTKLATSQFAQMTGIGDPEGINIEGPIRDYLDLPSYDRFEDYRVDRMLANQMGDDPSKVRELLIAGQEKDGPGYTEAIRRVNAARNTGIFANPAFWIFGLGGDTFPTGEQAQRALSQEFTLAITAKELGDSTAINRFFDKFPEYEGRLASFDSQEERMRFFLVDEFWVKYRALGSANKELVRKQLGEEFQELFLNKETRNYADIPLENLASWVFALNGYVPDNKDAGVLDFKDKVPDLGLLPPQFAKIVDDFRDTRNKKFPNWFSVQNRYFSSGPKGSDERKAYIVQWPELEEYWDWRKGQLEGNEFLGAFYRRYDLENDETGSLGSLGVTDILTNPILMRQLMADRYGGQSLTTGALAELRRIYELLQSPGGDFKEWIDELDFEQGLEVEGRPLGGEQQGGNALPGTGYGLGR